MNETTKNLLIIGGVVFGAALVGAALGSGCANAIHDHKLDKLDVTFTADEDLKDLVDDEAEVDAV